MRDNLSYSAEIADLNWRIEMVVTNFRGFNPIAYSRLSNNVQDALCLMNDQTELNQIFPSQIPYIPTIDNPEQRPKYFY